ncbi:MAG: phage portal protein, partial [Pseudomonadota bacterium]
MIDTAKSIAGRLLRGRTVPGEVKSGGVLAALSQLGGPSWGGLGTEAIIRDAYVGNVIAHKAVRIVSEGAASIQWETSHTGARDLLARPNPEQSFDKFMEMAFIHLLVSGNAYLESVSLDGAPAPKAMFLLRPDRVRAVADGRGWTEAWTYRAGGTERAILRGDGTSPLLHLKLPHPGDDVYGLSPLAAARKSIDIFNKSADWAKALLDNSARPSGALVYGRDGSWLTPDQFDRLKDELERAHSGAGNAGRPLLLEGGLD